MSITATATQGIPVAINLVPAAGSGHEPGLTRRATSVDRASDSILQSLDAQPQLLEDFTGGDGDSQSTGTVH